MTTPRTGFSFTRYSDDPKPTLNLDMSTVYLWGPSDDATVETFPLNTLVDFNSSDTVMLAALGTGPLAQAIPLINAQLGEMQIAARVIAMRTASGNNQGEAILNMVGDQAAGTGIFGALRAGAEKGVIPRLFCPAPGFTGVFTRATPNPVVTRAAKAGGNAANTGLMTLASPAYGSGGSAPKAGVYRVRCKTAASNGGVFSVVDPEGIVLADATVGVAYAGPIRFTIADGSQDFVVGEGFDVTVVLPAGSALANPICAALPQVLNAILAHAVVGGPGTTKQDADDWRETINSDRIIAVDCWVTPAAAADGVYVDGAPIAVGIGVRRDFESKGGRGIPSTSWHNQPVQGIRGLKRYDDFSWMDGATAGQQLLANNVGIISRGELGVETAAANSGFVFLGSDTCGDDELWRFYNVTRTRDWTHLQLLRSWRTRIGRENITVHGVQAVVNDAIVIQSDLKRDEHIVGGKPPQFVPDKNTPDNIRAGRIVMGIRQEEASPLLFIETESRRDRGALDVLIATIAAQANQIVVG